MFTTRNIIIGLGALTLVAIGLLIATSSRDSSNDLRDALGRGHTHINVDDNDNRLRDPIGGPLGGDPRDEVLGRKKNCRSLEGPMGTLKQVRVRDSGNEYKTCFGWDDLGFLKDYVDTSGYHHSFTHDQLGRLTKRKNPLFDETENSYDADGQRLKSEQSNDYSPVEPVDPEEALPNKRIVHFDFDLLGLEQGQRVEGGLATQIKFDANLAPKAYLGVDGHLAYSLQYDGLDRLRSLAIGSVDAQGNRLANGLTPHQYRYNDVGEVESVLKGENQQTLLSYSPLNGLQQVTHPDQSQMIYGYDEGRRLTSVQFKNRHDQNLHHIEYDYDDMNRPTEVRFFKPGEDPVWKTNYTYEQDGKRILVQQKFNDHIYNEKTLLYDGLGRLSSLTRPEAGSLNYIYGDGGRLHRLEHSHVGLQFRYDYDPLGRIAFVSDSFDNITEYRYNSLGHLAKVIPSQGAAVQYYYDLNDRMTMEERVYQEGDTTHRDRVAYHYDEASRLNKVILSRHGGAVFEGPEFRYQNQSGFFDHAQVRTAHGLISLETILQRDQNGLPTQWRDARGTLFNQTYDNQNRPVLLSATRDNKTHYRYFEYYADGLLKLIAEAVDREPRSFIEVRDPPSRHRWDTLFRRLRGLATYDDHLKSVVFYRYNVLSDVVEENRWIAGKWWRSQTEVVPVLNGLQYETTTPSGYRIERKLDKAERLASVKGVYNGSVRGSARYHYHHQSPQLDFVRYYRGTTAHYQYDSEGRRMATSLQDDHDNEIANARYRYNKLGQMIAQSQVINIAEDQDPIANGFTYFYDGLDRLRSFSHADPEPARLVPSNADASFEVETAIQRYHYNARGDLATLSTRYQDDFSLYSYTTRSWDGRPQSAIRRPCYANADGSLLRCNNAFADQQIHFQLDLAGHVRQHPDWTPEYDAFGRLVKLQATQANQIITYQYDGLGRLISRQSEGEDQNQFYYIWDGSYLNEIRRVAEVSRLGNIVYNIYNILHGQNSHDVVALYDRRHVYTHHTHPDRSTFLVSENNNFMQWYHYTPIGQTQAFSWENNQVISKDLADVVSSRLFEGKWMDPLTGFYLTKGTWYDPKMATRF